MKYYYIKSLEKILERAEGRKLILYGTELLSQTIYLNLKQMGRDIQYFVDDSCDVSLVQGKEVKASVELLYENKDDIYVICFCLLNHGVVYTQLLGYGLEFQKDFDIYGIGGYIQKYDVVDSMLGFSRDYGEGMNFKVYGNLKNDNAIRVMTLGGSTSDPTMGNYKSWPEQLYERLKEKYEIVVFSGGVGGYSTHQEFLKFMRDGIYLKPDILLSFDGYNDVGNYICAEGYSYLHRYQKRFYDFVESHTPMAPDMLDMRAVNKITHGISQNIADSENWFNGVRNIHALAEEYGIRYFSFLQPMQETGSAIIDESVSSLQEEYSKLNDRFAKQCEEICAFVKESQKYVKTKDYMYDLTHIFDGEEDVYYDPCHSTEKGHRIIMEHILKEIESTIEEMLV